MRVAVTLSPLWDVDAATLRTPRVAVGAFTARDSEVGDHRMPAFGRLGARLDVPVDHDMRMAGVIAIGERRLFAVVSRGL